MCGVFALFLNRPLRPEDVALGRAGSEALRHRGPDGEGEWMDREAGVFLGHRRLAIIDPSPASDQPMARDGTVIAFNGEIYNFHDLKQRLQAGGVRFTTSGDVETLLRAWQTWGEDALDRLDGMFGFAIWDGREAHVAVDPFAEKPLFVAEMPDGVYVSSEIGPLAKLLGLRPDFSDEDLSAYLALGFFPPPTTVFPQIRRLPPATKLTIAEGAIAASRCYWDRPAFNPVNGTARPLTEGELDDLHGALIESLKGRLYADVPLCLFLSSGVDSALIAAIASQDLGVTPKALTVSFTQGKAHDESAEAAAIAAHLGLEHEIIESATDPAKAGPEAVLALFGQPGDELPSMAINQMSEIAARNYKVALTGMGGDEIFLGYGKHAHFYNYRRLYGLPEPLRLGMGAAARISASRTGRFSQMAYSVGTRNYERYIATKVYPAIDWYRKLNGFSSWSKHAFGAESRPLEYLVPDYELFDIMPGGRLTSMDVASMRASLELRTPFLNRNVLNAVANFDPRSLMAFGQKSVLRRLLARYLPKILFDLPKRGFVFPANIFLDNYQGALPNIPTLTQSQIEEAWHRRHEGRGWTTLAVRMALLDTFMTQYSVSNADHSALAARNG
jgi:asparagine synthase (glutamine-hydrolysing)